ncbi:MAG: hypothetical protein Q9202_001958 [Teloschistes flavicans]
MPRPAHDGPQRIRLTQASTGWKETFEPPPLFPPYLLSRAQTHQQLKDTSATHVDTVFHAG